MITGKTQTGFEYHVEESVVKSWFFVEAFAKTQAGDITGTVEIVNLLFPGDEKARLMRHIAQIDPSVPTEMVSAECADIFARLTAEEKK